MNESQTRDRDQLQWLAFCYVENELDSVARDAFERQLEESQEAREALAWAVEVVTAMQLAGAPSPAPQVTEWRQVALRGLLAVGAALLLVVTVGQFGINRNGKHANTTPAAEASLLVDAWLQTRQALHNVAPDTYPADVHQVLNDTAGEELASTGILEDEPSASGWMMVALIDMQAHAGDGNRSATENQP